MPACGFLVEDTNTVGFVKMMLEVQTGYAASRQTLVFEGRVLQDGLTLAQSGVPRDSVIQLMMYEDAGIAPSTLRRVPTCRAMSQRRTQDVLPLTTPLHRTPTPTERPFMAGYRESHPPETQQDRKRLRAAHWCHTGLGTWHPWRCLLLCCCQSRDLHSLDQAVGSSCRWVFEHKARTQSLQLHRPRTHYMEPSIP